MLNGSEYISGKKAFKVLSFLHFLKSSLILGELISMQALMVKWNCSVKTLLVELFPIVNLILFQTVRIILSLLHVLISKREIN